MDRDGFNPLLTAVHNYQHAVVDLLLSIDGYDIGLQTNKYGSNVFHVAVYRKNWIALQKLLDFARSRGKLVDMLNARDKWGKTPLHHSFYHDFFEGAQILSTLPEVDNMVKDNSGNIACMYAGPNTVHLAGKGDDALMMP